MATQALMLGIFMLPPIPTEKVIVVMSEPSAPIGFHHLRSLAMSRCYPSYIRDNPHLSLVHSLLSSSLRPAFCRLEEEDNRSGFARYGDLWKRANGQYSQWVDEVRRPHYPASFTDDSPPLRPLPDEPNWFEELASLRFDLCIKPKLLTPFATFFIPL